MTIFRNSSPSSPIPGPTVRVAGVHTVSNLNRGLVPSIACSILLLGIAWVRPLEAQGSPVVPGRVSQQPAPEPKPAPAVTYRLEGSSPKPAGSIPNHPEGTTAKPMDQHLRADRGGQWVTPDYYDPLLQSMTMEDAMAVAEGATGGGAVSARRIDLNAASGGYEVLVRRTRDGRDYRVVIDIDTRRVRNTYAIPNSTNRNSHSKEANPGGSIQNVATRPETVKDQRVASAPQVPTAAAFTAHSDLYVWRDAKGTVNITSYPPPEGCKEIRPGG